MSLTTEVRHGTAKPSSLRKSNMFIQHDPNSKKIFGLWAGNKSDERRCIQPMKVTYPGDGADHSVLPEETFVGADTTSSTVTVTMPSPDDINDGHKVTIADAGGNANSNNVTIATPGSETIDESALDADGEGFTFMWDAANTNWVALP